MRKLLKNSLVQALLVVVAIEFVATSAGAERTMATTVNEGLMALLDRNLGNPVSDVVAQSIRGGQNLWCGSPNACGEWDTEKCEWFDITRFRGVCGENSCWAFETGTEYVKGDESKPKRACGGMCTTSGYADIVICGS
jgi:hypothetical protein